MFGDSMLDVGNNNHLPGEEVPGADKPYYGVDLPGSGKPTGRLSNGYNVADFVVTFFFCYFGISMYIPPISLKKCISASKSWASRRARWLIWCSKHANA
jgi:hypothetical protein